MRAEKYMEYKQDAVFKAVERIKLSEKESIIIMEIGYDQIRSASAFVEYIFEEYGFSRSTVWYNLKKLKKKGILSFSERGEDQKPLELTRTGISFMRNIAYTNASKAAYGIAISPSY